MGSKIKISAVFRGAGALFGYSPDKFELDNTALRTANAELLERVRWYEAEDEANYQTIENAVDETGVPRSTIVRKMDSKEVRFEEHGKHRWPSVADIFRLRSGRG